MISLMIKNFYYQQLLSSFQDKHNRFIRVKKLKDCNPNYGFGIP